MTLVYDGPHLVFKVAGMGPYDNNGYVIADPATKEAYLVDAPADIEQLLSEADGFQVKGVIVTHTHPDHVAGYADLKRLTDLPVSVHESDARRLPGEPDALLAHNDELRIGAIAHPHTAHAGPHARRALPLHRRHARLRRHALPRRARTHEHARRSTQVVASIEERLLTLPEGALVLPGHGADTTVAASKAEFAVFKNKPQPADLHGHVSWTG